MSPRDLGAGNEHLRSARPCGVVLSTGTPVSPTLGGGNSGLLDPLSFPKEKRLRREKVDVLEFCKSRMSPLGFTVNGWTGSTRVSQGRGNLVL